jgi:hypothetical protein
MSLKLTPIVHGDLCHGWRWSVEDIDLLAERVARVAMGQYRHVSQILEGLNVSPPTGGKDHAENAKRKMKVAVNGDTWQRDGWIFQIISWIAASLQKNDNTVLKAPHIFHAHKGFDGMELVISKDSTSIVAVVIFEDKATEDPRGTLYDDVFPAIVDFEKGERISELTHEATGLLEAQQISFPGLNIDNAIDTIFWQEARSYRISITTGKTHNEDDGRERLFKGYDIATTGAIGRRRAETMHFDNLRKWMDGFAALILSKIDEVANV